MNTHNQSPVAQIDQPEEEAVVGGSSQGCYGIEALVSVLALVHPLSSRVAKCHGYGGYIRVRKLEGWGKNLGE